MTRFILKRHPPTESDLGEESTRTVKGTLENEGTKLRWPDSYLYSYYFAIRLQELIPEQLGDLVLAHGNLERTKEDAKATSIALKQLGLRHEIREVEQLKERGLGDLADKKYEILSNACGSQGIHHTLFYAKDCKELIEKAGIPGNDYGEPFDKFIRDTVDGVISLWRLYKKPDDVVVLHTHSLRSVAILNVLHYIGYKSFKEDRLVEAIFDSIKPVTNELIGEERFDPKSGYWWKDIGYGEYFTINARREGSHVHVTESQPPSIDILVRKSVKEREAVTDLNEPLQKFTGPEIEYLRRVDTLRQQPSG